jgi:hypothetical protein
MAPEATAGEPISTRIGRRLAALAPLAGVAPVVLGFAWPLLLFGRLVSPAVALANRDVPGFHLALRTCLMRLAGQGWPVWNPWLTGGQPVLSNPNYAAFYPPTWLAWVVGPLYAFNLLVLLHLGLAFAGAWTLARRLGCGRGAAALAGLGYSGSGAYLSLLNAFTMFTSMAWFPWVLAGAVSAVQRRERWAWVPAAVLAGFALGIQVLNGDPVCEVLSGLALLLVALSTMVRRPARSLRLLVPVVLALGLSAVQLLPALHRLADSARAHGLAAQQATAGWSLPPQRLVELIFPRFFGDATRLQEGLYFGSGLDVRGEPYITSLYPGLLLALLGLGALFLPRLPLRWVWIGGIATGIFLALSPHTPLDGPLRAVAPALAAQRFPEKFVLLAAACLVFAGALGWQQLVAEPSSRGSRAASLPLTFALVTSCAAALAVYLFAAGPVAALDGLRSFGLSIPSGAVPAEPALQMLRREAQATLLLAAAAAVLFAALRRGLLPARTLSGLAVVLLAVDLWRFGHGFAITVPAAEYRSPPRLAHLLPAGAPIFVDADGTLVGQVAPAGVPPAVADLRSRLARFSPYTPVLWGIPYALNPDYDLTATRWSRLALGALEGERWSRPDLALRVEGAWGAATRLVRKPDQEWLREVARDPGASPLRPLDNPYRLARWRFVPRVAFHGSYRDALAAARAEGFVPGATEHCWLPGGQPRGARFAEDAQLLALADTGGRVVLRYRSAEPAFLVGATTFDPGWKAVLDGERLTVLPTALAQLATLLPPGEHLVELSYHEQLLPLGAAASLLALIGAAAALIWVRRPTGRSAAAPRAAEIHFGGRGTKDPQKGVESTGSAPSGRP